MREKKEVKKKQVKIIFENNEEIVSGLKQAFSEQKIERASISSVSGMITDIDIHYYIGGIRKKTHLNGRYKLMLLKGSLTEKGNLGYNGTLFGSLANENGAEVIGGDILKGTSVGETHITALIEHFKVKK